MRGTGTPFGSWRTAYDVDFTSLPAANLRADGNYTIDGKTWTVSGSGNSSTLDIAANGMGGTSTGGGWGGGGFIKTLPLIYCQLTQLYPLLSVNRQLRITAYLSSNNVSNSWESAYFIVGLNMAGMFNNCRAYIRSGSGHEHKMYLATVGQSVMTTHSPTNDSFAIEVPSLAQPKTMTYSGAYASGWPQEQNMTSRGFSYLTTTAGVSGFLVPGDAWLYLGGQPSPTVPNFTWRFSRLRVEYK